MYGVITNITYFFKGLNATGTPPTTGGLTTTRQIITTPSGQRVILMGTQSGQKQIVTVPGATTMTPVAAASSPAAAAAPSQPEVVQVKSATPVQQPPQQQQQQQQQPVQPPQPSLLMTSLTSPPKTPSSAKVASMSPVKSPDKFELTSDYIQQTIQQALRKDNLSPEIEQKLLALQQHNQDHDPPLVIISLKSILLNWISSVNDLFLGDIKIKCEMLMFQVTAKKSNPIDPATGEPMDDEWDGATSAERSIAQKNRRKKVEETVIAERIAANASTPVSRRTPSQMAAARAVSRVPRVPPPVSSTTTLESRNLSSSQQSLAVSEEKKRQLFNQKIQSTLLKHKEQLKRDISKKRSMQEKELTMDIKRDIEKIKGSAQAVTAVKTVTLTADPPAASTIPVS